MSILRDNTSIEPSSQKIDEHAQRYQVCYVLPRMKQLFDSSNHSHSQLGWYKPMISDAPKGNDPKDCERETTFFKKAPYYLGTLS